MSVEALAGYVEEHVRAIVAAAQAGGEPWRRQLAYWGLPPSGSAAIDGVGAGPAEVRAVFATMARRARDELARVGAHAPQGAARALAERLGRLPDEEIARYEALMRPRSTSSVFANAMATSKLGPNIAKRSDSNLIATCHHCGAHQERTLDFQCKHCGGTLGGAPR